MSIIRNIFKKNLNFFTAIINLREGKKIRRKSQRKGFAKITIISGEKSKETFGSYYLSEPEDISDYCSFTMEDVIAEDWIVDE